MPAPASAAFPSASGRELDGLETRNLDAVIRYYDAQTDDAQLTRAVVDSALALGGELAMPASFLAADLTDDGVTVVFESGGSRIECRARVLVNAAGPWATEVARAVRPAISIPDVDLVQGTHIVVPMRVTRGHLLRRESERRPRRLRHALARSDPDRHHGDRLSRGPRSGTSAAAGGRIPAGGGAPLLPGRTGACRARDILQRFAGLRVLPAAVQAAFDRSRETIFTADRDPHPRVLGIYGGKLTGWRAAAAHVLERIRPSLAVKPRRAATDQLVLRRAT